MTRSEHIAITTFTGLDAAGMTYQEALAKIDAGDYKPRIGLEEVGSKRLLSLVAMLRIDVQNAITAEIIDHYNELEKIKGHINDIARLGKNEDC